MFGIGGFEFLLILLFGFLIFGPDKLPQIAKTIGTAINKFKTASQEMNEVIKNEVFDPNADEPFKNPVNAASKIQNAARKSTETSSEETFAQRKARYAKESEERERDNAIKVNREKMRAEAAKKARTQEKQVASSKSGSVVDSHTKIHTKAKPDPRSVRRSQDVSADELFGVVPSDHTIVRERGSVEKKSVPQQAPSSAQPKAIRLSNDSTESAPKNKATSGGVE